MKKKTEEILTFDIFRKKYYEIWIPVQNLINPSFSLIDNNLIIQFWNGETEYKISNLPDEVVLAINDGNCLIVESLNNQKIKRLVTINN